MNSAWIGEHDFNLLGVDPCPNMLLAQLAGATSRIRLAPAVVLLPVHHALHVAEQWATLDLLSGERVDFAAGRGDDRLEYAPFQADFANSAEPFAAGLKIVSRAWTEPGRWSHEGKYYRFNDIEVRPRPQRRPPRPYVACFSKISMEFAARNDRNIIFAPFAAAMVYGSLDSGVRACADLVGSPLNVIDDLKSVEAAGVSEVILYFNYGLKPANLVKEQMSRFTREVAPAFASATSSGTRR
jgi:alkanesulfonate monooxygenase SsuD/methylene tetrahydromethanopterin reductase-like flavin-dependent oxidoreductase (luciferase family)